VVAASLSDIFAGTDPAQSVGGNAPLPLVDPGAVWLVQRGHVDVVALTISRADSADSADLQRTHLLRIPAGQLLFGLHAQPAGHNVLIMGYGSADALVVRLPVDRLAAAAAGGDRATATRIAGAVDRWVTAICALCAGDLAPAGAISLRAGATGALQPGQTAQPQSGVLWITPQEGAARFLGHDGPASIQPGLRFPVGKDAWFTAQSACTFAAPDSARIALDEAYWHGLSAFHDTVEAVIDIQRQHERESTRRRLRARSEADATALRGALRDLGAILNRRVPLRATEGADSALLAACRLVGKRLAIEVSAPQRWARRGREGNPLEEIAKASRFAFRRVALREGWHRRDGGPMIGFRGGGESPVALIPDGPTSYRVHDPGRGTMQPVRDQVAATLDPWAFSIYRCLPDRTLRGIDLLRFAFRGIGSDLAAVAGVGGLGAALALLTPVAVGHVFDAVIPASDRAGIVQITLGLLVAAVAAGAFQVTRNTALLRIKHRAGDALQAAVWERLVNLPVRFFGGYTAGDLGTRAMGISAIMDELSSSAIATIVSSVFSLAAVGLLVYYSPPVAAAALVLVLAALGVIVACGLFRLRYQRGFEEGAGRMAGTLLQFVQGIAKLRVAAAEKRAFARWADMFSAQTRLAVASRVVTNNLEVFLATFPVLAFLVIFYLSAQRATGPSATLSTGAFLAFVAAFTTLINGMFQLGATVVGLLSVVPLYDRLRPILEAAPEVEAARIDPGPLRGRIEVSNLSFRYERDGPPILQEVGFHADPGEFVAVVGPSGSGKSTLLRLLLGFERPESGTIAFDGFDLGGIDPWRLRRQLGVVLQDGDLLPGDIFTNIVGSAVDLTLADAWEAARLAGMAEELERMPMGMHTVITEGASTLSGGQRQRLMIARALVTRPRIVFFDEATSALDNPTQSIVTDSLDRMRATRVVIAHRLSTIIGADRIYVLDRGRIVQSGTYAELVAAPGTFQELVRRQIA
jgi:ATP-binding cassette subfamily C protein